MFKSSHLQVRGMPNQHLDSRLKQKSHTETTLTLLLDIQL